MRQSLPVSRSNVCWPDCNVKPCVCYVITEGLRRVHDMVVTTLAACCLGIMSPVKNLNPLVCNAHICNYCGTGPFFTLFLQMETTMTDDTSCYNKQCDRQ